MVFATILIIDPDQAMADAIAGMLARDHTARVWQATTAADARWLWERHRPDLVIVDPALPDEDGLALCQQMPDNPWIVATSTSRDLDSEAAYLDVADIFLRKPFLPGQILARIAALARRTKPAKRAETPAAIAAGSVRLDTAFHTVRMSGPEPKEIHLTPIEGKILAVLLAHAGQVCTRQFLTELVWGLDYGGEYSSAIKTHIRHLRVKIGEELIETVPLVGYRFVAPDAQNSEKQASVAVVQ